MTEFLLPEIHRQRWTCHERVGFSFFQQPRPLRPRLHRPVNVSFGVEPYVRGKHRNKHLRIGVDRNGAAFQVAGGFHPCGSDDIHAAGMAAAENDERCARIQAQDIGWDERYVDVDLAGDQVVRRPVLRLLGVIHILDIVEPLGAQQIFGDDCRRDAGDHAL
jgi:hypothetical protein